MERNLELEGELDLSLIRKDKEMPRDIKDLKANIDQILSVLADFKTAREKTNLPRKHFVQELCESMAELYGYSEELVEMLLNLFSAEECHQFLEANERPRPVTIRSNPLKVKRRDLAKSLISRGVNLDPVGDWTKLGLKITDSQVPIGATPEYLAGHYMLQSASSLIPVIALAPLPGERVADLCAAPGGKTTHIASLMQNKGRLVANDAKKERLMALVANLHRMGVENCTVVNYDARELKCHFGKFDRVLVDAPCTGLGVISRDESIRIKKTFADVKRCAHLQKQILLEAVDMVDHRSVKGGVVVYSTCSIMVQENEEVVDYVLTKRKNVKIVPLGVDFGVKGFTNFRGKNFHPSMALAMRYYPHVHNMDGFFVAKLVKTGETELKKKSVENEIGESGEESDLNKKRKNAKSADDNEEKAKIMKN